MRTLTSAPAVMGSRPTVMTRRTLRSSITAARVRRPGAAVTRFVCPRGSITSSEATGRLPPGPRAVGRRLAEQGPLGCKPGGPFGLVTGRGVECRGAESVIYLKQPAQEVGVLAQLIHRLSCAALVAVLACGSTGCATPR